MIRSGFRGRTKRALKTAENCSRPKLAKRWAKKKAPLCACAEPRKRLWREVSKQLGDLKERCKEHRPEDYPEYYREINESQYKSKPAQ